MKPAIHLYLPHFSCNQVTQLITMSVLMTFLSDTPGTQVSVGAPCEALECSTATQSLCQPSLVKLSEGVALLSFAVVGPL